MDDVLKYKQLLKAAMDLLDYHSMREHMTCSLPCIYCKHYHSLNSGLMCGCKFEWEFEKAIRDAISTPNEKSLGMSESALRELRKIID